MLPDAGPAPARAKVRPIPVTAQHLTGRSAHVNRSPVDEREVDPAVADLVRRQRRDVPVEHHEVGQRADATRPPSSRWFTRAEPARVGRQGGARRRAPARAAAAAVGAGLAAGHRDLQAASGSGDDTGQSEPIASGAPARASGAERVLPAAPAPGRATGCSARPWPVRGTPTAPAGSRWRPARRTARRRRDGPPGGGPRGGAGRARTPGRPGRGDGVERLGHRPVADGVHVQLEALPRDGAGDRASSTGST